MTQLLKDQFSVDCSCLILAGGKGSRLKNSNIDKLRTKPKPLVEIVHNGETTTLIDYTIFGLLAVGLMNLNLLTSSDPDAGGNDIEQYVANKHLQIGFIKEHKILGTGGAVFNACENIKTKTILITPSDTLFPHPVLPDIVSDFTQNDRDFGWIVTTKPSPDAQNIGKIFIEKQTRRITSINENEASQTTISITEEAATSTGIILAKTASFQSKFELLLNHTRLQYPIDLYRTFLPWILQVGNQIQAFDIEQPSDDLGIPERLLRYGKRLS